MDYTYNQVLAEFGIKPPTYPSRQKKENKLQAGMRRIEEKQALFNKMILRGRAPQMFVTGAWALPQAKAVNRVTALGKKQDVYFTPNHIGGAKRTEKAVDDLNCFFIDLDAGKDENGHYLQLDAVAERKEEMMRQIRKMPKATAIVETRNGYHVYWSIKPEAKINLQEWRTIQKRIVEITGSDSAVKDAARLLRMPYTFWMKASKGKYDTYLTRIVDVTTMAYTPSDLIEGFEKGAEEIAPNNITCLTVRENTTVPTRGGAVSQQDVASSNDNIAAIKNLDHQHFNSLIPTQPQRMTKREAATYLKSNVDLGAFLGLPDCFSCIFHDDKNPSAYILPPTNKATDWVYLCHSSNCSTSGPMNIIDVVMEIAGVDFNTALRFLAAAFNIVLPSSKRGRHIDQMINGNATALETIMAESKTNKKKLTPLVPVYDVLAQIVKETAEKTNTVYYGHDVYFAASARFITKAIGSKDEGSIHRKTVLLAALGLIEKVADDDLPESIKMRDFLFNRDLETLYGEDRTIQYYRLPAIDSLAAMTQVKKQLDKWIAGKGQIDNINERLITGIFGYDVAAAIYSKKAKKEAVTTPASVITAQR